MSESGGDAPAFTVAFQGEPGAYSEQATFELLGRNSVKAIGHASFDDAFMATNKGEVDLLMVPIENSLGGTIHANCDLQLQYNFFIIAEHDFRVRHCLMALPGTKKEDLTKIISHPQALAQCDSYIKRLGNRTSKGHPIGEAAYDTAGSAKMISDGKLAGVAAICSELAADYYGLEILDRGIEDDQNNFTRFLLLRCNPVRIPPGIPSKTSIVFSLENNAGALFKALSVFALRDIDLTKIESRPCKPDIVDRMERQFWSMGGMLAAGSRPGVFAPGESGKRRKLDGGGMSNYRYIFYADFQARADDPNAANALHHLQEITSFFRVLGSYPRGGALVGLENIGPRVMPIVSSTAAVGRKKKIGIIGFGTFGQFLAKKMVMEYDVFATSRGDYSAVASNFGVVWCSTLADLLEQRVDVIILSMSVLSFENEVRKLAKGVAAMSGGAHRMLVVDVLSVKCHAKNTMLALLPESCDILCTHPMFGPESGKHGWRGLPFVYERVRLHDAPDCEDFVKWWEKQGCRMVDMTCEVHDECAAGSQFVTHFTGRVLESLGLKTTPINTKGFESLLQLVENTCKDSFDLFFALYKYNPNSAQQLKSIEDAIANVSQQLREKVAGGQA